MAVADAGDRFCGLPTGDALTASTQVRGLWPADGRRPDGQHPDRLVMASWGVFYEKASDVKAALAAFLIGSSERRSVPESSIRTL